jgi:hypothetical protein
MKRQANRWMAACHWEEVANRVVFVHQNSIYQCFRHQYYYYYYRCCRRHLWRTVMLVKCARLSDVLWLLPAVAMVRDESILRDANEPTSTTLNAKLQPPTNPKIVVAVFFKNTFTICTNTSLQKQKINLCRSSFLPIKTFQSFQNITNRKTKEKTQHNKSNQ